MPPEISSVQAPRTASGTPAPVGCSTPGDPNVLWPILSWRTLSRERYRDALKGGALQCGIYCDEPLDASRPTVLFIHGADGAPCRFTPLAAALDARINCAVFVWDDTARLAPSAERLRAGVLRLPGATIIVAHSSGALLPAYVGGTDLHGRFKALAAVYLNPLIGGSRYAGDFRALRWLRLGAVLQRVFFRPSVLDLAPESDFQQTICGGAASSFASHTRILFTERRGREPDIPAPRVPHYFGCTREVLLRRFGSVRVVPAADAAGHNTPLHRPELVLPVLQELLAQRVAQPTQIGQKDLL